MVDCSLLADGFLGCDRWLVRFLVPGAEAFCLSLVFALFSILVDFLVGWMVVCSRRWLDSKGGGGWSRSHDGRLSQTPHFKTFSSNLDLCSVLLGT